MLMPIISMIILIILTAILQASETAIIATSDNKVKEDAEDGHKRAIKILKFNTHQRSYLTAIQVMITLLALVNGAIALDAFKQDVIIWLNMNNSYIEQLVIVIIALFLLVFHVVFGQLIPKRLGNKYPHQIAYGTIGFVTIVTFLLKPILVVLYWISNVVGRLFGLDPSDQERKMTEEEIRTIVEASSKTGNIEEEESEMIQNIFDFSDTTVDEIMTHRTEISALNVKSTRAQVIEYVKTEQFTRFPVYEESIDHIIGTLHVKDLLKYLDNPDEKFSIRSMIRPPYFIPESKKTSELFKEMQKQKNHIAIVLDEYGGTAGIVTIEDLIEEIVGNIFDEYDEEEEEIKQIDDITYEIDGLLSISDVEDVIEANLPVDDYDTLSGFILGQLGRFPDDNEKVIIQYEGFTFEVLGTSDNIITKVKVTKPELNDNDLE
ncbi:MAG: HlyC/CorC family transporter [Bacillota bacterium]|nr:MAG: HlyC/CorC family transporter [Bacillota bacterium]